MDRSRASNSDGVKGTSFSGVRILDFDSISVLIGCSSVGKRRVTQLSFLRIRPVTDKAFVREDRKNLPRKIDLLILARIFGKSDCRNGDEEEDKESVKGGIHLCETAFEL